MTIINRVGKPSRKRIVKTIIMNSIKTVEILSKDEEYYNGRKLTIQFQHKKNLIMFLKYKAASFFYNSVPAVGICINYSNFA